MACVDVAQTDQSVAGGQSLLVTKDDSHCNSQMHIRCRNWSATRTCGSAIVELCIGLPPIEPAIDEIISHLCNNFSISFSATTSCIVSLSATPYCFSAGKRGLGLFPSRSCGTDPILKELSPENRSRAITTGVVSRSSYIETNVAEANTPQDRVCMIGILDIRITERATEGALIYLHTWRGGVGSTGVGVDWDSTGDAQPLLLGKAFLTFGLGWPAKQFRHELALSGLESVKSGPPLFDRTQPEAKWRPRYHSKTIAKSTRGNPSILSHTTGHGVHHEEMTSLPAFCRRLAVAVHQHEVFATRRVAPSICDIFHLCCDISRFCRPSCHRLHL